MIKGTHTVKLRVPFTGYVDFAIDVSPSTHSAELSRAKSIVQAYCHVTMEDGRVLIEKPVESIDIRPYSISVDRYFNADEAEELNDND